MKALALLVLFVAVPTFAQENSQPVETQQQIAAAKPEAAPTPPKAEAVTPSVPKAEAAPEQMEVTTKSASEGELEKLQYLTNAIQEDLKEMSVNSKEVVETTTSIGRMMIKMRQIDARSQQKPIVDSNVLVNPNSNALEQLKSKFEDFKDEHWSRFAIPNFEYRFFKRDRDLVTVQNPVTLKKILDGIALARSKFMPAACFNRDSKTFNSAPICQKRLALCGQSGFESQDKQLVAFNVNSEFKLEAQPLDSPDDAEAVLGNRYDTSSDRATLLSDETFYFCKVAARFGATFKAEPLVYPAEVAQR